LFSDIPDNAVHRWKEGEGVRLFLKPSGYTGKQPFTGREPGSNGLVFDTDGRLVLCQHGDRCIGRLEKDGSRTILVDHYEGRKLNSPNDLVFKSNGDLYFTDPPYGLPDTFHDPARELDFCGVYRLRKEGELTLLAKHLAAPNGIAFSPDESILYVSDSKTLLWLAFDVREDGTIENCRTLYNASEQKKAHPGCPDGMKLDVDGNIFGAGPGGVYVIAPDGILLGKFDFGAPTGNCAWGEEGSTLFVTCNDAIYRIRLTTKGAGWNH
jgi:gluconolactonase